MRKHQPKANCSEPIERDDGEPVVICQENAGPGNQVGGGEFKNVDRGRGVDEAAREQEELEKRSPTR